MLKNGGQSIATFIFTLVHFRGSWIESVHFHACKKCKDIRNKLYKRYDAVVFLSNQANAKLSQELKSDFERTINWNKHQSEVSKQTHNKYFDYLIDPKGQIDILLYRLKIMQLEENTQGISSESENKRLQCYKWWQKVF